MTTIDRKQLEAVANELLDLFDLQHPPIPIEMMLQRPKPDMWEELDITQLSGGFLSIKEPYSPRMSLARLLARHIAFSPWGQARGLEPLLQDPDALGAFARMLIMPTPMVLALTSGARNPTAMSVHFEVPEGDARQRLVELTTGDA